MKDKRKRIIELVKLLDFPYRTREVVERLEKLNEEELEILISSYEEMLFYKETLQRLIKKAYPEKYNDLLKEYKGEILDLKLELINKEEREQERLDAEIEQVEKDVLQQIGQVYKKQREKALSIENIYKEISKKLNTFLSSG